jgi:TrmH family RNA methyltransferase
MTQRWQKLIRQLQQKKYRRQEGLFLVEGEKSVLEVLQAGWEIAGLHCTEAFVADHPGLAMHPALALTTAELLGKIGAMATNERALAVVAMPPDAPLQYPDHGYLLALDDVRDPGNLGTILRIADWYGMAGVVCSPACADRYGPKTVAASMGSFLRVPAYTAELPEFLAQAPDALAVVGAGMHGQNAHQFRFPGAGVLVMGSESHGLSAAVQAQLRHTVTIPRFGGAESLNVAVAAAVLCDRIKGK